MVGYRWAGVDEETVPDGGFFPVLSGLCPAETTSSSGAGTDSGG